MCSSPATRRASAAVRSCTCRPGWRSSGRSCSPPSRRDRHRAGPAHADRARGRRAGRGVGAVPVGLRGGRRRVQHGRRAGRRRERAGCATSAASRLSERSWIFGAQRAEVGRDGSLDWVALGFGSARGRVRMETRLGGPGADARVTGAYATPRPPAHRLRHHAGARRARTRPPTSPSAACSRAARPRSGGATSSSTPAPRRPTLSRSRATCCSPSAPTPTRSRASRSRPTTCAARTPRRSPRSTPSSCSTCARTASARTWPSGW